MMINRGIGGLPAPAEAVAAGTSGASVTHRIGVVGADVVGRFGLLSAGAGSGLGAWFVGLMG
jgi:hypothetical protein